MTFTNKKARFRKTSACALRGRSVMPMLVLYGYRYRYLYLYGSFKCLSKFVCVSCMKQVSSLPHVQFLAVPYWMNAFTCQVVCPPGLPPFQINTRSGVASMLIRIPTDFHVWMGELLRRKILVLVFPKNKDEKDRSSHRPVTTPVAGSRRCLKKSPSPSREKSTRNPIRFVACYTVNGSSAIKIIR